MDVLWIYEQEYISSKIYDYIVSNTLSSPPVLCESAILWFRFAKVAAVIKCLIHSNEFDLSICSLILIPWKRYLGLVGSEPNADLYSRKHLYFRELAATNPQSLIPAKHQFQIESKRVLLSCIVLCIKFVPIVTPLNLLLHIVETNI